MRRGEDMGRLEKKENRNREVKKGEGQGEEEKIHALISFDLPRNDVEAIMRVTKLILGMKEKDWMP
jgi:hypothetical protein